MKEEEMQACLEAGDLPGTPSEVRAIEKAYAIGRRRAFEECINAIDDMHAETEAGERVLDAALADLRKLASERHSEEP